MFEQQIANTKLAGMLADCMFRRISGCGYDGDISFISTLRAMLMHIDLGDNSVTFNVATAHLDDMNTPDGCSALLQHHLKPDTITYLAISAPATESVATNTEQFFVHSAPEMAHEFMDVREFFAQKMACRAMINEQTRSALIVVLSSNMKKHHLAQCIMPKLMPWYFTGVSLSALQRRLLSSLTERYQDTYERTLNAIADTDWYRQRSNSAAMSAFKRRGLQRKKDNVEKRIRDHQSRIDILNQDLIAELRSINDMNLQLNGVLLAIESEDSGNDDLTDFLTANPDVEIMSIDGDYMQILVKSYLDVYDPDAYASMSRNPNSWYWSDSSATTGPFISRQARKQVLDAIFSDNPTFKIRSFGIYKMNCNTSEVGGSGGRYSDVVPVDRYANPHLYYASCLGSYRSTISRAMTNGDIVGAISQCIASAHSVNVTESATFRHLCRDIFVNDQPILEGPEGRLFTTLQAYEYLNNANTEE